VSKRVLVAISDATSRADVVRDLTEWGYEPVSAGTGREAWKILRGPSAPRIALLDTELTELDGFELCRRARDLRGDDGFLLMIAPNGDRAANLESLEAGADGVVDSPIHPRELRMRLSAGLRGRRLVTSEAPAPAALLTTRDPSDEAAAGAVVARKYQLGRIIGRGGMGTVWRGTHLSLRMPVAIKFIKGAQAQNPIAKARFELEAKATARLRTKYAVKVFDCGTTAAGVPYLVMEYLEGPSLLKYVHDLGPLSFARTVTLVAQAAQALGEAHAHGIIHRDVKPDNVLLVSDPDSGAAAPLVAKLIDFGVAKVLAESNGDESDEHAMMPTGAGLVVGTPNFMAPEQLRGVTPPNIAGDLWALAACAFTAITGRIPFEGSTLVEVIDRVCAQPPPVPSEKNPDVSPAFDAWFARACDPNPARRFRSAQELATSLARAYAEQTDGDLDLTPSLTSFVAPPQGRRPAPAAPPSPVRRTLFDLDEPLSA
jgi:serine/threonine protein kinase